MERSKATIINKWKEIEPKLLFLTIYLFYWKKWLNFNINIWTITWKRDHKSTTTSNHVWLINYYWITTNVAIILLIMHGFVFKKRWNILRLRMTWILRGVIAQDSGEDDGLTHVTRRASTSLCSIHTWSYIIAPSSSLEPFLFTINYL